MTSPEFISVERAREMILDDIGVVPAERLFLNACAGRHIAETIRAPNDVPAFDNSSRDGYALRWADVREGTRRFEVVATAAAGRPTETPVGPGEAARIMTGAKLPDGADSVVMQEHVESDDQKIVLRDDAEIEEGSGSAPLASICRRASPC